ncbi:MAG: deoxyribose-phosphate aldolase [Bacteroidales bacterium]|jgi:deoxyribose-phosphate aldolase|nr:deoxyribose-phosphate aldolase [Bacteroidales bacterium]
MDIQYINHYIDHIKHTSQKRDKQSALRLALSCLDLTSLNGSDTEKDIIRLCKQAMNLEPHPAAICIFAPFCKTTKSFLKHTNIKVASVAGGFPSGQLPLELKLHEVKYAISEGADEIDMVISRTKFLEGRYAEVYDEIASIKALCGNTILKVIIECGELQSIENIYKASEIAIEAGANFVKTSTGKININATPQSFTTILLAIKAHYEKSEKMVGIKVSGGIKKAETALEYINLLYGILNEQWLHKEYFRIGASSLALDIEKQLHIF